MLELVTTCGLLGRRILIVEDDHFLALAFCHELKAHGAEIVGPAANVGKAFDLLDEEGAPDLAVLDADLTGQPVFPLADALVARASRSCSPRSVPTGTCRRPTGTLPTGRRPWTGASSCGRLRSSSRPSARGRRQRGWGPPRKTARCQRSRCTNAPFSRPFGGPAPARHVGRWGTARGSPDPSRCQVYARHILPPSHRIGPAPAPSNPRPCTLRPADERSPSRVPEEAWSGPSRSRGGGKYTTLFPAT